MTSEENKIEEETNVEPQWEDITEDGAVFKKILKEGSGYSTPDKLSEVEVHYVGTLEDGSKFDSSRDRNDTFKFKLGTGSVIKGWDVGVKTMKKGEVALLKIRSDYGYGERGSPPKIPANATLIFEVELIGWSSEKDVTDAKDKGVLKKTLQEGEGWEQPNDGTVVKLRYSVKNEDTKEELQNGETSFTVGDEETFDGLDIAAKKLKKNEIAEYHIRSDYIFGGKGNADSNKGPIVEEGKNLFVELELIEMQKEKEAYQLEVADKVAMAQKKKTEGNEFFKANRFSLANKRYKKALSYIAYGEWDSYKTEVDQLKVSCHLNTAAILLRNKEYQNVITELKKVTEIEPSNVKALYRRAQAYAGLADYQAALTDLNRAADLDQGNREVKREIYRVKQLQKEQDTKDQNLYAKMLQGL